MIEERPKRCRCGLILIELCFNCGQPKPEPYHHPDNGYGKTNPQRFAPSGKFICIECEWPYLNN